MGNMESWPDEYELLEFFEAEPTEANSQDGFWCYEKNYDDGSSLTFSFNTLMGSVQTDIMLNGKNISSVCHEGATNLSVLDENGKRSLKATFKDNGYERTLNLEVAPTCSATWSTIEI